MFAWRLHESLRSSLLFFLLKVVLAEMCVICLAWCSARTYTTRVHTNTGGVSSVYRLRAAYDSSSRSAPSSMCSARVASSVPPRPCVLRSAPTSHCSLRSLRGCLASSLVFHPIQKTVFFFFFADEKHRTADPRKSLSHRERQFCCHNLGCSADPKF